MTLTPNMEILLVGILGDVRCLEAVPDKSPPGMRHEQWRTLWRERRDYDQFGVYHDLAHWLYGKPNASDSAVFSRALRHMEATGLVVRLSRWGGTKTTHVRLTPYGRAEAERLLAEQEAALAELLKDLTPLVDGLNTMPPPTPQNAGNSLDSPSPPR